MEKPVILGVDTERTQDKAAAQTIAQVLKGELAHATVPETVFQRAASHMPEVLGAALLADGICLGGEDVAERYKSVVGHIKRLQRDASTRPYGA